MLIYGEFTLSHIVKEPYLNKALGMCNCQFVPSVDDLPVRMTSNLRMGQQRKANSCKWSIKIN